MLSGYLNFEQTDFASFSLSVTIWFGTVWYSSEQNPQIWLAFSLPTTGAEHNSALPLFSPGKKYFTYINQQKFMRIL